MKRLLLVSIGSLGTCNRLKIENADLSYTNIINPKTVVLVCLVLGRHLIITWLLAQHYLYRLSNA